MLCLRLIGGAPVLVAAFYRFAAMERLPELRQRLLGLAQRGEVRGTILPVSYTHLTLPTKA